MHSHISARDRSLPLSKPLLMGILNVTPDSFSDGGTFNAFGAALAHARNLLADGADIIDIGGESTRPGFTPVSADEELRRVVPIVSAVRREFPNSWISIDTVKAAVAEAALDAGADIVNDVSGAADPRMFAVAKKYNAGLVLTHGWEEHLRLEGKGGGAGCGLRELSERALAAGIAAENIILDPGFGFGKKGAQNAELLAALPTIVAAFKQPILVGVSRKHFLESMYPDADDADRRSVLCALDALRAGAKIFRVHNPAAHNDLF